MPDFTPGNQNQDPTKTNTGQPGVSRGPVPVNPTGGPQVSTNPNDARDQRNSTANPVQPPPGLDRALGDSSGRSDAEAQRQAAERGATADGPKPVPTNYNEYAEHIKSDKYKTEFDALSAHKAKFDAEGGEEKRKTQKLALTEGEIAAQKAEFEKKKDSMSKEDRESEEARLKGMQMSLPSAGKSMPQLKSEAEGLRDQIKALGGDSKNPEVKALQQKMEGIMQASLLLGTQIDPVGSKMGRELYNKIDKVENPALSDAARGEGQSEEQVAHGAVDNRNNLRHFLRSEMMDPTAAEILYLRDEGKTGSRMGMSYDQVQSKETNTLKKEGKLPTDFDMAGATEEQKAQVYAAVIGSARTTNTVTNAGMTGSSTGGVQEPAQKPPGQ